jgi:predicted phosphate transport protein (TIGR00153 family)
MGHCRSEPQEDSVRVRFLPQDYNFFEIFEKQSVIVLKGATMLHAHLENYGGLEAAYTASKEIHELEHAGDDLVGECLERLNKTFITPFDREDIFALTRALDEILDYVDAVAERLVILQITHTTPMLVELARIIRRGAEEVQTGVRFLRNLGDPDPVLRICKTINSLENDGDQVLHEALRLLFQDPNANPLEVIKLKDVYENLELATDRCQDVSNILHTIVAKYT